MERAEYRDFRGEFMDQVLEIYSENGWTEYLRDRDRVLRAFRNSLLILGAFREGKLVGFVRCVGDGETVVYVQDLIVRPAFRRQGIGSELMRRVSDRYPDVRQFLLITDENDAVSNAFYRAIGMTGDCHGFPVTVYFRKNGRDCPQSANDGSEI